MGWEEWVEDGMGGGWGEGRMGWEDDGVGGRWGGWTITYTREPHITTTRSVADYIRAFRD